MSKHEWSLGIDPANMEPPKVSTTLWLLVRVRRYNSAYLPYLYAYALGYSFFRKSQMWN
jgi:hypothetical protein